MEKLRFREFEELEELEDELISFDKPEIDRLEVISNCILWVNQ